MWKHNAAIRSLDSWHESDKNMEPKGQTELNDKDR